MLEFDKPFELGGLASLIVPQYVTKDSLVIPRHYESVWNFAIGVEYQYTDHMALRAGWEPRTSSVPDDKLDVLLPLGDPPSYLNPVSPGSFESRRLRVFVEANFAEQMRGQL